MGAWGTIDTIVARTLDDCTIDSYNQLCSLVEDEHQGSRICITVTLQRTYSREKKKAFPNCKKRGS